MQTIMRIINICCQYIENKGSSINLSREGFSLDRSFVSWTGDFLPVLVVYRSGSAVPYGFTFFLGARPPAHFRDLEFTGTKEKASLIYHKVLLSKTLTNDEYGGQALRMKRSFLKLTFGG